MLLPAANLIFGRHMASAAPTSDSTLRPLASALAPSLAPDAAGAGAQPGDAVTDLATRDLSVERAAAALREAENELAEDSIPARVLPLPVTLAVAVPVRNFRVRNLLAMRAGTVLETQWGHGEDIPLASGDVPLAWAEFEVVDTQLGVRVTRLA